MIPVRPRPAILDKPDGRKQEGNTMRRQVQQEKHKPVDRTSTGLRDVVFDEIDALRSGASNPSKANAVAKLCGVVIDSVNMEIAVEKHLKAMGEDTTKPKATAIERLQPVQLGTP